MKPVYCPACQEEREIVALGPESVKLECGAYVRTLDDGLTWVSLERHRRFDTVKTPEEFALLGHMRGWCHNSDECPLCKAQRRASDAEAQLRPWLALEKRVAGR